MAILGWLRAQAGGLWWGMAEEEKEKRGVGAPGGAILAPHFMGSVGQKSWISHVFPCGMRKILQWAV
ncbi:hypothetical protein CAQU_11810 [Corynebacterium aquilae DSM 44791]|uniref:Uncharacterized protein n=1 Tax=Corynebacterium aquilae DSM 44791 TaxID=1431546 RepID=A0A1L7CIC6_9CORY|nr:hypothetical protein CAQU_11810 [Corynebacterium aquilae DSM 44791]